MFDGLSEDQRELLAYAERVADATTRRVALTEVRDPDGELRYRVSTIDATELDKSADRPNPPKRYELEWRCTHGHARQLSYSNREQALIEHEFAVHGLILFNREGYTAHTVSAEEERQRMAELTYPELRQ